MLALGGSASALAQRPGASTPAHANIGANCYERGQSTNCHVNHEILLSARAGSAIEIWYREESRDVDAERDLIRSLTPAWNIQRP